MNQRQKKLFMIFILVTASLMLSGVAFCTSFAPDYPYKQWYEGQDIVIYHMPYSPFERSVGGITKVYRKGTLLYTIPKFFRDPIITSRNGRYLFVINGDYWFARSPQLGGEHDLNERKLSFHHKCIDVYKDGKLYKEWTLADVIDTTRFSVEGDYRGWMYYVNIDSFEQAQHAYDECRKQYGPRFDLAYASAACKIAYDSVRIKQIELHLENNAIYEENNEVNILTCYNTVIKIHIPTLKITEVPFSIVVPDKDKYSTKWKGQYLDVLLPSRFSLPYLKYGKSMDTAIAELFHKKVSDFKNGKYRINLGFIVNKRGRASEVDCQVYFESGAPAGKRDEKMAKELLQWVLKQRFKPESVPGGYDKYHYFDLIRLE